MKRFLDLRVRVDLYHEAVNHSPLPWAGISYTVSMSPMDTLRAMLRKNWRMRVESATLSAVVTCYRQGILRPSSVRLMIPNEGKTSILGIASHGPHAPSFWRRVRRLTPSGRRHERSPAKPLGRVDSARSGIGAGQMNALSATAGRTGENKVRCEVSP